MTRGGPFSVMVNNMSVGGKNDDDTMSITFPNVLNMPSDVSYENLEVEYADGGMDLENIFKTD